MLVDRVEMPLHIGTHIDALNHVAVDNRLFDGSRASDVEAMAGASTLGVDTIAPFIARGVLLDIAAVHGVPALPGDHEVTPADLAAAIKQQNLGGLTEGSVVVIHTGWMSLYSTNRRAYFEREPGLGIAGAQVLADAGVRGVAADNSALDSACSPDFPTFPTPFIRNFWHVGESTSLKMS